jgi:hypothetical protein
VKLKTHTKTRPHRDFADDIDIILHGYGPRVRVVQLWRRLNPMRNEWTYIGRVPPEVCEIELIGRRFGGGEYRAKLLGDWDTERRQEEYLEQVTFCLDDQYWPITAETRERIGPRRTRGPNPPRWPSAFPMSFPGSSEWPRLI